MGPFLRNATAVGLLYGAVAGFLVCLVEWPFANYTLLGNEVIVTVVRGALSADFARAVDTPLRLFLLYTLAGAFGGLALGVVTGIGARVLGRKPDTRARTFLHSTLILAAVLTIYTALGVLHFRLPPGTRRAVIAALALLSLPVALAVSFLLTRAVPKRELSWAGWAVAALVIVLAGTAGVSILSAKSARARDRADVPVPGRNGSKVVVFCLDGTGWDVMQPLRAAGKLPNISRIVESGSWGYLRSTMPPIKSPQVWTSIATSRLPEDHQVWDFLSLSPATGQWGVTTNRIRRVRTFWDVAADLGVRTDVLSWYPSWPPDSVRGVMLTDRASLERIPDRVFPASYESMLDSLLAELEPRLPETRRRFTPYDPATDGDADLAAVELRRSGIQVLDQTYLRDEVTLQFAKECLQRGQADLTTIYFRGTDSMQHKFRKFYGAVHDPLLAGLLYDVTEREADELGGIIDSYFEYVDECVGEIAALLDPESTILFVSDHGHSYRSDDQVNLEQNPLLVATGLTVLRDDKIDFERTRYYGRVDGTVPHLLRVYVNLAGREESGTVSPDEYRSAVETARERLAGLRTRTGVPVFTSVEEGKRAGRSGSEGDLRCLFHWDALGGVVELGQGAEIAVSAFAAKTPKSGNHRITGIFAIAGKNAAVGRRIRGASIYDVTPTIFYLLDLPLSAEWVGDPLLSAVSDGYRAMTPVRWVASYESEAATAARDADTAGGADEAMLEELRALGYIQ